MSVFGHKEFDGHEQVVFCADPATGLRAIVAIHNTNLGPALGGCRMWHYASDEDALTDVLRLSKGMTYKAAMAGLPLGGGKSVIVGDSRKDKSEALLHAFGRHIDSLGGRYITAEDVGTSVADMDAIHTVTEHVVGITGGAEDPSPSTAHGVYIGIQAAVRHKLGRDDLNGVRVAVQGVGHVGHHLCRYLREEGGADLIVTDVNVEALAEVERAFGATVVEPEAIFDQDVEVLAPCALGAVLDDDTIPRLKCPIVAGAANNQLAEERHGQALYDRGIVYAPDYVINAGGLLDVARFAVGMSIDEARAKLHEIGTTLREIFERSEREGLSAHDVADKMAEERFLGV